MTAKIENGCLVVSLPLAGLRPSNSGKTLIVATSNGNQKTALVVEGKPVTVGVNAYVSK